MSQVDEKKALKKVYADIIKKLAIDQVSGKVTTVEVLALHNNSHDYVPLKTKFDSGTISDQELLDMKKFFGGAMLAIKTFDGAADISDARLASIIQAIGVIAHSEAAQDAAPYVVVGDHAGY